MPGITPEFAYEYEAELTDLFRRRVLWYVWTMLSLTLGLAGIVIAFRVSQIGTESLPRFLLIAAVPAVPACLVYGVGLARTIMGSCSHSELIKVVWWIIQLEVFFSTFLTSIAIEMGLTELTRPALLAILISHTMACLFLPWTTRQCLEAFAPQLWIWATAKAVFDGGLIVIIPEVFFAPLVVVPGLLICTWRMSSFERSFDHRMVRRAFSTLKRELVDARRVHESLFPKPISDGRLRLWYSYQPMRQIGGDYLHVHTDENGRMHLVVIDVTGHGIAAALTVNRLAGEIERLHAEGLAAADLNQDGQLDPGELLAALNRYIWFTLSRHSVFATALCARLDPGDEQRPGSISWASGGHPPAYLRRADGRLDDLESTTFMLGAVPPEDFHLEEGNLPLRSGDCLVAYTDGAFENMDRAGTAFGLQRLRETVSLSPRTEIECIHFLRQTIDAFRHGPNDDDILIVAASLRNPAAARQTVPPLPTREAMAAALR